MTVSPTAMLSGVQPDEGALTLVHLGHTDQYAHRYCWPPCKPVQIRWFERELSAPRRGAHI